MTDQDTSSPSPACQSLAAEIDRIADQLAQAVGGNFDFSVRTELSDMSMQKLVLMLNFLIDATQRSVRDSEQKNAELTNQLDMIERQQRAIAELSTPILQLWQDILVLPVIGFMDSQRAEQMMERLLEEVCSREARYVIVDVTGVPVVDTRTADYFTKIFNSVRLLGAQTVLTGIRPAVAQTLVEIGVEMQHVVTRRNLQQGLEECLRHNDRARTLRAGAPQNQPKTS